MSSRPIRILNFDDSLVRQERLVREFSPVVIDLKDIGPAARMWMDARTSAKVGASLDKGLKSAVTFTGSGDYHHVSETLIGQFSKPLTVVIFDHHPDWDVLPPRHACGAWVSRVLEQKNIVKVILVGVSSQDISAPAILTGNLSALAEDRLEIYPYTHAPTKVFGRRVPANASIVKWSSMFSSEIRWTQLADADPAAFMADLAGRLPTEDVYVSLDKDCLKSAHALTNWEEGCLELEELLAMLKALKGKRNIVGMDVTGEYSPVAVKSPVKKVCSHFDHPRFYSAYGKSDEVIHATNERTNLRILERVLEG